MYSPVARHDFVNFDDPQYVSENANVSGGFTWHGVSWAFTTGHAGNWHPLTWVSHMLDVQVYGLNAGAHHVSNVVLHIASSLLLFGLLYRMTGALGRSGFVAALFAVHPLHVESVAWIAERKDVLSTLFWMLTIWAYLAYVRHPRPGRYLAVVLLFALGLMAKPMLVTLPFVLLLLDFWPLGRFAAGARSGRLQLILEKTPLFTLAIASSIVTFAVQQQAGAVKGFDALPLGRRVANALVAFVTYVWQTLWPTRLAAVYPYPASVPGWWVIAAIVGLTAVSALAIRARRRQPYLLVGWLWYLGTLVPVIGLIQVGSQPTADRYTYVPLIGLFIIVAWGVPDLLVRWPPRTIALPAVAALVISACTITARSQVRYWESSTTLWEHALNVTTANYRAHNNVGHALATQGRLREAIPHYAEALRIKPDYAEAHNSLGLALAGQGRVGEAIAHYGDALRLVPAYFEAHSNLGAALAGQGRYDDAIRHFSEAVRLEPDHALARQNLGQAHRDFGRALAGQGRVDEAIREFLEALRLEPGDADLQYDTGVMFVRGGDNQTAVRHFETALKLDPGHQAARHALDVLSRR